VHRPKNQTLAANAAEQARVWGAYQTSFDILRAYEKDKNVKYIESQGLSRIKERSRELFHQRGKWRAIKYATRRNGPCCQLGDNEPDESRGVTCSQFVIMCYQTAGLERFVKRASPAGLERASDKKATASIHGRHWEFLLRPALRWQGFCEQDIAEWKRYVERLEGIRDPMPTTEEIEEMFAPALEKARKNRGANRPRGYVYVPSIRWWLCPKNPITSFPWDHHITQGMMLDCKSTTPAVLHESLLADEDGWEHYDLEYNPVHNYENFTAGQKQEQKDFQARTNDIAEGLKTRLKDRLEEELRQKQSLF
jgi:hypothetical protein